MIENAGETRQAVSGDQVMLCVANRRAYGAAYEGDEDIYVVWSEIRCK
jgi:hypothetical protein